MSSERAVFLDTEVLIKGRPHFALNKTLDVRTHFKATERFQYTHFSSCHPLSIKKGFVNCKGRILLLLRTNSTEEKFESYKRDFQSRLLERSYPCTQASWKNTGRSRFLTAKRGFEKQNKDIQKRSTLFVATFNPYWRTVFLYLTSKISRASFLISSYCP